MRFLLEHPAKCFGYVFGLTLLISYLGLAWIFQSFNLLDKVVHEDGQQTFLTLLFNPSHFLREIPISIMICVGVVGSYIYVTPGSSLRSVKAPSKGQIRLCWILASAIVVVAILATAISQGIDTVWHELGHFKTRGDALKYGSHWHNHFLHVLFIPVEALGACALIRWGTNNQPHDPGSGSKKMLLVWIGVFLVLWPLFGFQWTWANEPLYLAHQLREIGTHGVLTLSLTLAICFYLDRPTASESTDGNAHNSTCSLKLFWSCLGLCLSILGFLLWRLRSVEVLELAQKEAGYLELYFSHNFEHFIDYLFMGLVTAGLFLSVQRTRSDP